MAGTTGYGKIWVDGSNLGTHRVSWQLAFGAIPHGKYILHHCDNPACVRPSHLFLGTHQENMADGVRKGRFPGPRGEKQWKAKLTSSIVRKIRAAKCTQRVLAKKFGIHQCTVSRILAGERWAHI
jgi:HNH endonuclease